MSIPNEQKIVVLLGAGSSYDFNQPTNAELKAIISRDVDRNGRSLARDFTDRVFSDPGEAQLGLNSLFNYVGKKGRETGYSLEEMDTFREFLINSCHDSVDAFVGSDRESSLGRLLIAAALLFCEYYGKSNSHGWIGELINKHFDGASGDRSADIVFVSLNYERTFEWHLEQVLTARRRAHSDIGMNRIQILKPYGCLGTLEDIPFAFPNSEKSFALRASNNFTLVRQGVDTAELRQTRELLQSCGRILALGYGFWESNNTTLGLTQSHNGGTFYATRIGLDQARCNEIKDDLRSCLGNRRPLVWADANQTIASFLQSKGRDLFKRIR